MRVFENNDPSDGNVAAIERREFMLRWSKRLACVALFAVLLFAGVRVYGSLRERHLTRQLQQFVARGEYQSGVLVARRLLALDENNLAACSAMAEMAENAGRVDAVFWRKRVVHLEPHVAATKIALARTALRFGQRDLAQRVLDAVAERDRQSVGYHEAAGALALAEKQFASAEAHLAAAARLDGSNPHLALNLAFVHLASADEKVAAQARKDIALLAAQSAVRLEAVRALTADSVVHVQKAEAMKWAAQLRTEKGATFSDILLCLRAYEATDKAAAVLEELKVKAAPRADSAAELITWLNRNGMAVVAAHWSSTLPISIRETQPVPLAVAESYSFMQDWPAMMACVEGKNWGEFEALRLAVESHALHRLNSSESASMQTKTVWRSALETAKQHPGQIAAIAQLAEGWGYADDAEEAWWIVASANNEPKAGLAALQRLYKTKQDTRGLLRVAKRALELNPQDLVAANNCASLGLLIGADSTARRLAAKLYNENPTVGAFAATYAFALKTEGKTAEALKLMETLKDEELRQPAIAAYYLVMLVDGGELERARKFLPSAKSATLLPEEQQLLNAATRKLIASATADATKAVADLNTR